MKRPFFLLSILALLVVSAVPSTVRADEMVKIDKTKIRLSIVPGQAKTGIIDLENPSDQPKTVRAYLEDWTYLAPFDGSKDFTPAGTRRFSGAQWITFNPTEVVLGPYGRGRINYTVKVPETAQGGYYASLFLETLMASPGEGGVGVNLAVRVAVLFFIEAEGTVTRNIELKSLSVGRANGELTMNLPYKNAGNVDLTAGGTFNIMNADGMIAARGNLNDSYTLPGDSSELKGSWSLPIPPGEYSLVLTIDIGKAVEEAGMGRGPVIVKETTLKIGANGEVKCGELL